MALRSPAPQQRRAILKLGAAGLAIALAGCVPRADRAPPATPSVRPQPTPTQPSAPNDRFGDQNQRHRVAVFVPMTGPNAAVGQSIANAANLALLDTGGDKVRITVYDTTMGAAAAAQRALADGNRLFLGPLLSADVAAIAPAARSAGVPVISFSNDESAAGDGVYLMGFTPSQSIERVVAFARTRGMTRFVGLMPSGMYGRRASSVLIRAAEQAGGSVVGMQTYDRAPASIDAAVKRLDVSQGYDAVLIADSGRMAMQVAPMIRKRGGESAQLLGTELWNTETSINASPVMQGAWFASVSDVMYRQLATKYRARFGVAPYRLASLGYDAVLLTVKIARDWKVGAPFPIKALTDRGGFSGVDGAFRFDKAGIAERALVVQQVGQGGFSAISPAPRGFAD
jgi:ABC-type branched-subunit amino acid transport system substrate-binding protein